MIHLNRLVADMLETTNLEHHLESQLISKLSKMVQLLFVNETLQLKSAQLKMKFSQSSKILLKNVENGLMLLLNTENSQVKKFDTNHISLEEITARSL
jgi:hypothetical protein